MYINSNTSFFIFSVFLAVSSYSFYLSLLSKYFISSSMSYCLSIPHLTLLSDCPCISFLLAPDFLPQYIILMLVVIFSVPFTCFHSRVHAYFCLPTSLSQSTTLLVPGRVLTLLRILNCKNSPVYDHFSLAFISSSSIIPVYCFVIALASITSVFTSSLYPCFPLQLMVFYRPSSHLGQSTRSPIGPWTTLSLNGGPWTTLPG
jgi:hypothetical protein